MLLVRFWFFSFPPSPLPRFTPIRRFAPPANAHTRVQAQTRSSTAGAIRCLGVRSAQRLRVTISSSCPGRRGRMIRLRLLLEVRQVGPLLEERRAVQRLVVQRLAAQPEALRVALRLEGIPGRRVVPPAAQLAARPPTQPPLALPTPRPLALHPTPRPPAPLLLPTRRLHQAGVLQGWEIHRRAARVRTRRCSR